MVTYKKILPVAITLIIIVFISIVFFVSCNDRQLFFEIDCDECFTNKPDSIDLVIDVSTKYGKNGYIDIIIYEGKYEDNKIYLIDSANYSPYYVFVPVEKQFTACAIYKNMSGENLLVIDGSRTKLKKEYDECSETCWYVKFTDIDLRVKFNDFFE